MLLGSSVLSLRSLGARICRWPLLGLAMVSCSVMAESLHFEQIQPIFERHCVECHQGWFPKGGLRLDSLENLREGGKNGPSIFPGEPDKGRLINMIRPVPGRFSQMPPGAKSISDTEFEQIRRWIEQGAN